MPAWRPRPSAYLMLHQQDCVGLVTFDNQVRTHAPAVEPGVAPEGDRRTCSTRAPAGKHQSGSDLPRPGRAHHSPRHGLRAQRHVRRARGHPCRPQAPAAQAARGRRDAHAGRGRAEFPVPGIDAVSRPGAASGAADRPALAAARAISRSSAPSCSELELGCRSQNIDYVQLRTDQSLGVALSGYLAHRLARKKGS